MTDGEGSLHLHKELEIGPETVCEVYMDQDAQVYLMDDKNYTCYRQGEEFSAFGGLCSQSPARVRPSSPGVWHLAIEQLETARKPLMVRVAMVTEKTPTPAKPRTPVKKTSDAGQKVPEISVTVNPGGTSFVIQIGNVRKTLGQKEMGLMLQTYVRGTNPAAKAKLVFNWLQKERLDVLTEGDIGTPASPVLQKLLEILRKTFPAINQEKP